MEEKSNFLTASFTDSAEEEVKRLVDDLELAKTLEELKTNQNISPELRHKMLSIIATFADLFSATLPDIINNDLDATLEVASRDINLSRLLRERGLFRIFRLIKLTTDDGLPVYIGMVNPLTGETFKRMEDLIGYFCEASHVSRSLVFSRLKTIDNCVGLGMDLEKAFKTIVAKPYAISETLRMVGDWEHGELTKINPDTAQKLIDKFGAVKNEEDVRFDNLAASDNQPYTQEEVKDAIVALLDEVAAHDRVKDVLDFVRHDILDKPEITYKWEQPYTLVIEMVRKELVDGKEYVAEVMSVPFYPDIQGDLPKEIKDDLIKRLPIANKNEL